MKTFALAVSLVAAVSFAQDAGTPVAPPGFKARAVTKGGDKKGVDALYLACDEALKKGDIDALAARIDFPLTMITDTAAGVPVTLQWERQAWVDTMKRSAGLPKDLKLSKKTKVTFLSDSLAMVEEANEQIIGKAKDRWLSGAVVQRRDGQWMFKAMIEGGWGELVAAPPRPEPLVAPTPRLPVKALEQVKTK